MVDNRVIAARMRYVLPALSYLVSSLGTGEQRAGQDCAGARVSGGERDGQVY